MFDQTIASAAIANRIKSFDPRVLIAFGGYAVRPPTAEMLLDAFPSIDAICVGEGEPTILPLAVASAAPSRDLSSVPNIFSRDKSGTVTSGPRAPLVAMDAVPTPDFDDFFEDVKELGVHHCVDIAVDRLPLENSRGCWWGATHHCVFCGIHDDDMGYRARSAESALAVLAQISERYDFQEFRFADYILPHQYYSTLLPMLAAAGTPYRLKGELKANVNEKRARLLADAGFVEVQPGIESFSGSMLKLMDKGVSGVQNVFLLLLGRRLGIVILYNILYGLPGEDPEATEAMVSRLRSLRHLDPPSSRGRIQITRYAPLQADVTRFGFGALRHERAYDLIFSEDYLTSTQFDLDRYCYTFELPYEPAPRLARSYREIDRLCDEWSDEDKSRDIDLLYTLDAQGGMTVHDSRVLPVKEYTLNVTEAELLRVAERPRSMASLRTELSATPEQVFEASLKTLRALGLVFEDEGQVVSLALPQAEVVARRHWWDNYSTRWSRTLATAE
jgi:ribosomal peptide maturation radical SAM protein 1